MSKHMRSNVPVAGAPVRKSWFLTSRPFGDETKDLRRPKRAASISSDTTLAWPSATIQFRPNAQVDGLESKYGMAHDYSVERPKSVFDRTPCADKNAFVPPLLRQKNTGLPHNLKHGIEMLSGISMDDVTVHFNSSKPAELDALAYTLGTDVHLGPGQEKHLGHEAWHVVQQKQGRVKATTRVQSVSVNDDSELETEADRFGREALLSPRRNDVSKSCPQISSGIQGFNKRDEQKPLGSVAQRVGESKYVFLWRDVEDAEAKKKQSALISVFGVSRDKRRVTKDLYQTNVLAQKEKYLKDNPKLDAPTVMLREYPKGLSSVPNLRQILEQGCTLKEFMNEIEGSVLFNNIEIARVMRLSKLPAVVANPSLLADQKDLRKAFIGAFRYERPIYRITNTSGEVKEYVKDSRGILTRRFAYVEKNFWQLIDFCEERATRGKAIFTGRYQTLNMALGLDPNPYNIAPDSLAKLSGRRTETSGRMSHEQLAVLHQYLGNSMQQRGVSLTSTPRRGAVFSNAWKTFRRPYGALLTVDLARVPTGVALINHYAEGGVKDVNPKDADVRPDLMKSQYEVGSEGYSYVSSVIKNREIFLEVLDSDWIDNVSFHGDNGDKEWHRNDGDLHEWLRHRIGYDEYTEGFKSGKAKKPDEQFRDTKPQYAGLNARERGIASGQWYEQGKASAFGECVLFMRGVRLALGSAMAARDAKKKPNEPESPETYVNRVTAKVGDSLSRLPPRKKIKRGTYGVDKEGETATDREPRVIVLGADRVTVFLERSVAVEPFSVGKQGTDDRVLVKDRLDDLLQSLLSYFDAFRVMQELDTEAARNRESTKLDVYPDIYWKGWAKGVSGKWGSVLEQSESE